MTATGGAGVGGGSGQTLVSVPNDADEYPVPKAEGLAATPPMGWNSWNAYSTAVSADLIMRAADLFVSSGLKDAGYNYVNIDDGWALKARVPAPSGLEEDSTIEPDPVRFPPGPNGENGISVVADYVHSLGLKLGIYSDRGSATCGGYAASGGHEVQDAQAFSDWGVDYLKYDSCNVTNDGAATREAQYRAMSSALRGVNPARPLVFSLCSWQFDEWNAEAGELWRTTGDIAASFNDATVVNSSSHTVLQNANSNTTFAAYARPNAWNDPDMLEVGNLGTSLRANTESRTHFSLWAMMAAPLIAGNKIDGMTEETRAILTNGNVIAVDQDALGLQGVPVLSTDSTSVWAKPLNKAGARAVLLMNAASSTQTLSFKLTDVGLSAGKATLRDLWDAAGTDKDMTDEFSVEVPAHGSMMYEVDGQEPGIPMGTAFLSDLPWTYAANAVGPVERDRSNGGRLAGDGKPLTLRGTAYPKGLGISAGSKVIFRLAKKCSKFSALVGVDDETKGAGSVQFQVLADGERLYPSAELATLTGTDAPQAVEVDLTGKQRLTLLVTNAGDGAASDRADWADAKITCSP